MNTIILKEYYSPINFLIEKKIPKEIKKILEGKTFQEYRMKFFWKIKILVIFGYEILFLNERKVKFLIIITQNMNLEKILAISGKPGLYVLKCKHGGL
jgi:hypothetical protein